MDRQPQRLVDSLPESDPLQRALRDAQNAVGDAQRVQALRARLGSLPSPSAPPTVGVSFSIGRWLVAGGLVVGGALGWRAVSQVAEAPPLVAPQVVMEPVAVAPIAVSPPDKAKSLAVVEVPATPVEVSNKPPASRRRKQVAPLDVSNVAQTPASKVQEPTTQDPKSELLLLQQAIRSLAQNPRGTMALLDEHLQRFQNGVFAQERESLRVDALRALGRIGDARAQAKGFLKAFPQSPQRLRLQRSLAESSMADHKSTPLRPLTSQNKEVLP